MIEEELISYARIDLCNVGGLTEALKITRWCETHYIDIAPHNPLGPVSAAACVALCMASSNVGVCEMPKRPGTFDTDLFAVQIDWMDGFAFAPDRPGLGVEFDEAVAESRADSGYGWPPVLRRNYGAFTNWYADLDIRDSGLGLGVPRFRYEFPKSSFGVLLGAFCVIPRVGLAYRQSISTDAKDSSGRLARPSISTDVLRLQGHIEVCRNRTSLSTRRLCIARCFDRLSTNSGTGQGLKST